MYEMQRRRFQNVQEDEAETEKRDTIDDLVLRELTRGYTETGNISCLLK